MIAEGSLVTAKDLAEFAGRRKSRTLLPHMVRKLLATTPGVRGLSMPAGEEVWREGWDGSVDHVNGNAFLPAGALVWEMSTEQRSRRKAEQDYAKRTADPLGANPKETTFIFLTMRSWRDKEKWAQEKRDEGIWRDVRVMDSDDLWAWLESNNEVHIWVSQQMGRRPRKKSPMSDVPTQLPSDEKSFIGRDDELEQLSVGVQDLSHGGLVVVSGQPGVGKTAFAVHFAHHHAVDFPDGQLYVDLRGTHTDSLNTESTLSRVLRSLGVPPEKQGGSEDEMAAVFRMISSKKRFIIILDNAASEKQVRLLKPGNSRSLVIVTSRDQLGGLDCHQRVHLETLPVTDAVSMLVSKIGKDRATSDPVALAQIASICGFLPLALQIAARLAEQAPTWRLDYLAKRLSDEQSRLDRLKIGDLEVRASFQLSYQLLDPEQRSAFRKFCLIPGTTFDATLAKVALGIKKVSQAEAIVQLMVERGLVQVDASEGRFRIHDLLRLFGEEKADEEETEDSRFKALSGVRSYLLNATDDARLAIHANIDDERAKAVRSSVQAGDALLWLDDNYDNVLAVIRDATKDGVYNPAITMTLTLTAYLELRADWANLREVASLGRDILNRVRKKGTQNDDAMAFGYTSMLACLAKSAHGRRKYEEALAYCDEAEHHRGPSDLGKINKISILNVRGLILRSLNQHTKALEAFQECADFWQHRGVSHQVHLVEHNIGATLMDMGQAGAALPYLYRDLNSCRTQGDVLGEAHTLNTIGLAWKNLQNYKESEKSLVDAIARYRSQNDSVHEGYALNDLGLTLYMQGRYDEAYNCHWLDLSYCLKRHDWPGSARSLIRLADNLISKDSAHASLALQYVKVALNYLDDETDRDALAASLTVLADLGYVINQTESADSYYQNAVQIYRELGDSNGIVEAFARQYESMREYGDLKRAAHALQSAIDAAREHAHPGNEAALLFKKSKLFADESPDESAEAFARAEELLEGVLLVKPEDFSQMESEGQAEPDA